MNSLRLTVVVLVALALAIAGCDRVPTPPPASASGVSKASVTIATGQDGLTAEQRNVKERLTRDNKPGSVKHLYIISPTSGDVLVYSTVKGKVTSSAKRLDPSTVLPSYYSGASTYQGGWAVNIGGTTQYTTEALGDDGTYGKSSEYYYWFDQRDVYWQFPASNAALMLISDQPINVGRVILNFETLPIGEPGKK